MKVAQVLPPQEFFEETLGSMTLNVSMMPLRARDIFEEYIKSLPKTSTAIIALDEKTCMGLW